MAESRIIALCARCWRLGEGGAWVGASEIGQNCHQCEDGLEYLEYIPRYRKRRAWIVKGRPYDEHPEYAFLDHDKALCFERKLKEEQDD